MALDCGRRRLCGCDSASGRNLASAFLLRRQVYVLCTESSCSRLHHAVEFLVSLVCRMRRQERLPLLSSGKCFWGLQQCFLWRSDHPDQLRGMERLRLDRWVLPRRRLPDSIANRMHQSPKLLHSGDRLSMIAGHRTEKPATPRGAPTLVALTTAAVEHGVAPDDRPRTAARG
jgi:hypothetical protein